MADLNTNNPDEDKFSTKLNKFFFGSVEAFGKYLAGKTVASIVVAIATFVFCYFMDIKPAWLLATISGIGNMIPILGPWVVLIICALVTVFQEPINALYIVIFCLGIQALDQFFITPLIVGKSIDLNPLIIIIVLVVGSSLLGFWGLIFAVPIAAVIKLGYTIFIKNKDSKKTKSDNNPNKTSAPE
jgi:predicted PurR-regulated permease PerM